MELDQSGADVDWQALDKAKFFTSGLFLFSGATCILYPLSVIKTRQMVRSRSVWVLFSCVEEGKEKRWGTTVAVS